MKKGMKEERPVRCISVVGLVTGAGKNQAVMIIYINKYKHLHHNYSGMRISRDAFFNVNGISFSSFEII